MALDGVKESLSRQVGPLPLWGWALAVGGGFLAYRYLTGGGAGNSPITLGDAASGDATGGDSGDGGSGAGGGGGNGGGDGGGSQPPIPVPGGSGGNGVARTILTVTHAPLPFQKAGNLGHVAGHITNPGAFYVEHVTLKGDGYYRILGRVGPNGTLVHSSRTGFLIRDRPELRKLFHITHTQATTAA